MAAQRLTVELYFDCISPFTFLAFTTLQRYAPIWKFDLVLKPVLLGGVMASTGNLPPGARPWAAATSKVGAQDLDRSRRWFNVPLLPGPANFFGPDGPADKRGLARDFRYQRTLTAIRRLHTEDSATLATATRLVMEQIWMSKEARDVSGNVLMNEEVLTDICKQAGLSSADAQHVVEDATSTETKDLLKSTVAEAVSRGMYGSPFIAITGAEGLDPEDGDELVFFGSDRFEQMAFALKKPWYGPDPARPTVGKL